MVRLIRRTQGAALVALLSLVAVGQGCALDDSGTAQPAEPLGGQGAGGRSGGMGGPASGAGRGGTVGPGGRGGVGATGGSAAGGTGAPVPGSGGTGAPRPGGTGGVPPIAGTSGGGVGGSPPRPDAGGSSCGPVCDVFCEYGNVPDDQGCPTCACNPAPAPCKTDECGPAPPVVPCGADETRGDIVCARGAQGACAWKVPACEKVVCPAIRCLVGCPNGTAVDEHGCQTCTCLPAPACTPKECGPAPGAPDVVCGDGSSAGFVCAAGADGACGWQRQTCAEAGCEARKTEARCQEAPACLWMGPFCGASAPATGCYASKDVACLSSKDCPAGKKCVERVVSVCSGAASMCGEGCTAPMTICL